MYMPNGSPPSHPELLESGLRENLIKSSAYHSGGSTSHGHMSKLGVIILVSVIVGIIVIVLLVFIVQRRRKQQKSQAGFYNKPMHAGADSTINLASAGAPPSTGSGGGFSSIVSSLTGKAGSYMPVANNNQGQSGNLGAYEPPAPPTVGAGYVSGQPYNPPPGPPPAGYSGGYAAGGPNEYPMAPMGGNQNVPYGSPAGYGYGGGK